jgi:hypothetical protein
MKPSKSPDLQREAERWINDHRVRLAWSNPNPSPELMVRLALLEGNTFVMADALTIFGLDYLKDRWSECMNTKEGVDKDEYIQFFFESARIAQATKKQKAAQP